MKFKNKEQVHDYLNHSKVYVDGQSKEVQEVLFKYGFLREIYVDKVKDEPVITNEIGNTFDPFIFVNDNVFITGSNMDRFQKNPNIEFDPDEILSIELEKVPQKYEFRPFDKVLMCDPEMNWRPEFFRNSYFYKETENTPAHTIYTSIFGIASNHCIPFEGNEGLIDQPYNNEDER